MKKVLVVIMMLIAMPAFADDYFCNYYANGTYYSSNFSPDKTVEQYCKTWCDSDFWIENGKCAECTNQDYPRLNNAYNAGSCKKIMPPKVFDDVEGCKCQVYMLEDGKRYSTVCSGSSSNGSCNTSKAMKKLDWMLTE